MDDAEVITRQARKIEDMEVQIHDFEQACKRINGILFNIGAPLNDNILGYTNKQLEPFARIARELEDFR